MRRHGAATYEEPSRPKTQVVNRTSYNPVPERLCTKFRALAACDKGSRDAEGVALLSL